MNRIAPTIAPCIALGADAMRLGRAEVDSPRSWRLEDRVVCHPLSGIPPAPLLAHPDAIAAQLFVPPNDTRCPLAAPDFAPAGGAR